MNDFIQGAITMGNAVAALFFLRFWKKTGDSLLAMFSLAFGLMTLRRLLQVSLRVSSEHEHYMAMLRLLPYVIIIFAIVNKNRGRAQDRSRAP